MRALRSFVLCLIVLLVIAAVVVSTLPAQLAWRLLAPRAGSVQMSGISGSVWHGHADRLSVASAPLGALDWRLHPAALLHGRLRADVHLSGDVVQADGQITRLRDGRLEVRDLHLRLPASQVQTALDMPNMQLLGSFDVDVRHAIIHGTSLDALDASARWHDAGVSGSAQARFGDVLADFSLDASRHVIGRVHDAGGPLAVKGQFRASLIGYTLIAHLRARDPGNYNLQEVLMQLGQRQPDGSVLLRAEGKAQLPTL